MMSAAKKQFSLTRAAPSTMSGEKANSYQYITATECGRTKQDSSSVEDR